jgi:hypothetical protein
VPRKCVLNLGAIARLPDSSSLPRNRRQKRPAAPSDCLLMIPHKSSRKLYNVLWSVLGSAVQCSAVQLGSLYSAPVRSAPCNPVHRTCSQCSAVQCIAVQCSAVQCSWNWEWTKGQRGSHEAPNTIIELHHEVFTAVHHDVKCKLPIAVLLVLRLCFRAVQCFRAAVLSHPS